MKQNDKSVFLMPINPPDGYRYKIEDFNRTYDIIKLIHPDRYTYTSNVVWTVWGFVKRKTGEIHSPINSKKPGEIAQSYTEWTAMPPPKLTPLESAFF